MSIMTDLQSWAPVISSIVAAVAALIALANVLVQNFNTRRTRAIDIVSKKEAEFDSERMVKHRVRAAKALLSGTTENASIDAVLDFMESAARFVTKGDVPAEELWFTFYLWFNSYYVAARTVIAAEQAKDKTSWEDLGRVHILINRVQRKKGKPVSISEPTIKNFLQGESELLEDDA